MLTITTIFFKKLAYDALQEKNINKMFSVDIREQRKTILELKAKLMSLKIVETCTKKGLEGCGRRRYVKNNGGLLIEQALCGPLQLQQLVTF